MFKLNSAPQCVGYDAEYTVSKISLLTIKTIFRFCIFGFMQISPLLALLSLNIYKALSHIEKYNLSTRYLYFGVQTFNVPELMFAIFFLFFHFKCCHYHNENYSLLPDVHILSPGYG